MDVQKNDVVLYGPNNLPIREKSTPDFDPDFLKSFMQIVGGTANSNVNKIKNAPYANHSWVYACAHKIAQNISRLKPVLFKENSPEDLITKHPFLDVMRRPNGMMNTSEFFEAIVLNLMLPTTRTPGGQCFIVATKFDGTPVNLIAGEIPDLMFPFSDEQIEPKTSRHDFQGWIYKHPSGEDIHLFPEQIVRMRLFNPYNWLLGLSPLSSLMITVLGDAKAAELFDKYMDNSANIGGLLTTDTKLNPVQAEDLKKMWQQQYEGFSKAGKTALLHSGLKFEQTARSLVDLQFKDQKEFNRQEIMSVYGCSKTILGLSDSVNRATAQVEKELFWEDTLIPIIDKIWDAWNVSAIRFLDNKDLQGSFDLTNVESLKKNLSIKIKDAKGLIDQGVPPAEAYRVLSIPVKVENYPWLKLPIVNSKQRLNLDTGEVIGGQKKEEPKEEPKDTNSENEESKNLLSYVSNLKNSQDDKNLWSLVRVKTIQKPATVLKTNLVKYFVNQRNELQTLADLWLETKEEKANIDSFISNVDKQNTEFISLASNIYDSAIELQTYQMSDELNGLCNFTISNNEVNDIKVKRFDVLKAINTSSYNTLKTYILKQIAEYVKGNIDRDKLVKNIKLTESNFYKLRINTVKDISEGEIGCIANDTRIAIMKCEGITKHRWLTAQDEHVRETHKADASIGAVSIGSKFPNSGLYQPQGKGSKTEVLKCRCITAPNV